MSLPDCDPTEGAFQEHPWNIDTPRQHKKGNITEASWEELDQSIPDCDEQLKTLREDFFDTEPRMIKLALEALEPLLEPEFGVTTSDSTEKLGNIRRIIILAEHAVVLEFIQQKERSYSYVRPLLSQRHKPILEDTIKKLTKAAKKLIIMMDKLHKGGHRTRAYEYVLLYAPLRSSYLAQYMDHTERFEQSFHKCKPSEEQPTEIQTHFPLYIPFFVYYLLTKRNQFKLDISYKNVCDVLQTWTYGIDKYREFARALEYTQVESLNTQSRGIIHSQPTPLGMPFKWPNTGTIYDPVESTINQYLAFDPAAKDYFPIFAPSNYAELSTLRISIPHYMIIAASDELQRKAKEAGNRQTGKGTTTENSNGVFEYDWNDVLHDAVANQAITDLFNLNIMVGGRIIRRVKASIYHAAGGIITPSRFFQIVIPTIKPDQPSRIILKGNSFKVSVEWTFGSLFLLSENTILSPSVPISYISITMPL